MIRNIDIFSRARLVREIHKSKGALLFDPAVSIITIHDTHQKPAFRCRDFRHLALCFDDIEPGWYEHEYPSCRLATEEDAAQVVRLAGRLHDSTTPYRLIVNCEAGISRSAAVATAIADLFDVQHVRAFQGGIHPNAHVRRVILHAARQIGLYDFPAGSSQLREFYGVDKHDGLVTKIDKGWWDDRYFE